MNPDREQLPDQQQIDDYASGLVDGVVRLEDIDQKLRAAVGARADLFVDQRRELRRSITAPTATAIDQRIAQAISAGVGSRRPRIIAYVGSLAAAAAVVAVVGIAVTRSSEPTAISESVAATPQAETSNAPVDMATAMSMAPMAADPLGDEASSKMAPLIIANLEELENITRLWSQPDQAPLLAVVPQCPDSLRPAVSLDIIFDDQPAEIHFSVGDGVVVYRLDDCLVMVGIVP